MTRGAIWPHSGFSRYETTCPRAKAVRVGLRGYRTTAQRFGEARKASSVRYQHSSPISAIDGVRNCLTSNLYAGSERPGTGRVMQRASSLGYALGHD